MIDNMDGLREYTEKMAASWGEEDGGPALSSPGCSDAELAQIRSTFPEVPNSYLDVIRDYQIFGVNIGWYQVYPDWGRDNLLEALIFANNPEVNAICDFFGEKGLLEVASCDGESICVSTKMIDGSRGTIYSVDTCDGTTVPVARSFEEFMLLAGNRNAVELGCGSDEEGRRTRMSQVLQKLNVPEDMKRYWLMRV